MATLERSHLYVEGKDDLHVIGHLLSRNGINLPSQQQKDGDVDPSAPEMKETGGWENLLEAINTAVPVSSGRSVGFMLDADDKPQDRWSAVRARLQKLGLEPPEAIPADGYVADVAKFRARVGVWLMPDNQQPGDLEQFLTDLVDKNDCLLSLAKSSTHEARKNGAKFPEAKNAKAVLHTWLAWQEKPGLPYGSAIGANFFCRNSSAALAFVAWYKRLFSSPDQRGET